MGVSGALGAVRIGSEPHQGNVLNDCSLGWKQDRKVVQAGAVFHGISSAIGSPASGTLEIASQKAWWPFERRRYRKAK